jgi:hypothetical protein
VPDNPGAPWCSTTVHPYDTSVLTVVVGSTDAEDLNLKPNEDPAPLHDLMDDSRGTTGTPRGPEDDYLTHLQSPGFFTRPENINFCHCISFIEELMQSLNKTKIILVADHLESFGTKLYIAYATFKVLIYMRIMKLFVCFLYKQEHERVQGNSAHSVI